MDMLIMDWKKHNYCNGKKEIAWVCIFKEYIFILKKEPNVKTPKNVGSIGLHVFSKSEEYINLLSNTDLQAEDWDTCDALDLVIYDCIYNPKFAKDFAKTPNISIKFDKSESYFGLAHSVEDGILLWVQLGPNGGCQPLEFVNIQR